jgi:serine/threonine-protein kinase
MGTVYRARDEKLNRDIALKVVTVAARSRGEASHRFLREAQSIAMLDHPNIVHIYDIGEQDGFLFLAMELVEGGNLAQRIEREGAMSFGDAARIVLQLARAVDGAHLAGIIHRDLKPGNILLSTAGDPRITDFGLAKWQGEMAEDEEHITRNGVMLGTPGYMAPEQIRGDPDAIGPATDVYALGTILYECMTGRRPFQDVKAWSALYQIVEKPPQPPSAIRPDVPAPLDQICLKCLEKDPRKRYSSAELLAQALERWLDGRGDNASAAMPRPIAPPKPRPLLLAVKPVPVSLWTLLQRWFSGSLKS